MKKKKLAGFFIAIMLFPFSFVLEASDPMDNTYPSDKRLFHIARSVNKNLVCYDINLENGKLDLAAPLNVYWVNREKYPGKTNGLNYIQRKMAYGYKLVSAGENSCVVNLVAYPGKKLTIACHDSQYVCYVTIDNQQAILRSLYVKASPNNPLSVEYVELQGISVATNQPVTERVKR